MPMVHAMDDVGPFDTAERDQIELGFHQFVPMTAAFFAQIAHAAQRANGDFGEMAGAMANMGQLFEPLFNMGESDAVAAYWATTQFNLMRKGDEPAAAMCDRYYNDYSDGNLICERGDFRRILRMFYYTAKAGLGFVPLISMGAAVGGIILANESPKVEDKFELFESYFDLANQRGPEDVYMVDYDWWYMGFFETEDEDNDILAVLGGDRDRKLAHGREARDSVERNLNQLGRKVIGYKHEPAWIKQNESEVN